MKTKILLIILVCLSINSLCLAVDWNTPNARTFMTYVDKQSGGMADRIFAANYLLNTNFTLADYNLLKGLPDPTTMGSSGTPPQKDDKSRDAIIEDALGKAKTMQQGAAAWDAYNRNDVSK